jgi:hypothetical protein
MRLSAPTTGFSFSPGGLLLPYHVGALEALVHNDQITPQTPLAGSSAGSIAVAAHACGVDGPQVLATTAKIAQACAAQGGARGRLLGPLRAALNEIIQEEEYQRFVDRPGAVAVAYQEVLPFFRSRHQAVFEDRDDLVNAICHSSSFPFFTSNWPCVLDTSQRIPRLVVDGFFAVPRERFGCPDFELVPGATQVDRTVMISVFPRDKIQMNACAPQDCISPEDKGDGQLQNLLKLATQSATRQEYAAIYEAGWKDAERWCQEHANSKQHDSNLASQDNGALN